METRDSWGSNAGFILAAVGGAVGLGNLWGFAFSASQGGGAAFVLLYLVFVSLVGIPVLTVELAIGRQTNLSTVPALERVGGARWRLLGVVFVLAGFGILSFYSVIMGWTGRMLLDLLRGAVPLDTGAYFGEISQGTDAIAAHFASMLLTILVVVGGVQRGIERVSVVLMPVLFVLLIGLAAWAATLSGGGAGYAFYLSPDLSKVFDGSTIRGAAGQAFFSLSLGMGAMITYASYLKGPGSLPFQAGTIALSDTLVAFTGGLVTFPIVYHFGLQADISASSIGALFIAIPRGVLSMGAAGVVVGVVFFVALYIAALTSAISLLEVVTAALIDTWGWARKRAALVAGGVIAVAGIPSALSTDWLGLLFSLFGQVFLIFGGFWLALVGGYVWTRAARDEVARGFDHPGLITAWIWLLRLVVPPVTAIVLYFSVLGLAPAARALFEEEPGNWVWYATAAAVLVALAVVWWPRKSAARPSPPAAATSRFWRCPHCRTVLQKPSHGLADQLAEQGGSITGVATCPSCMGSSEQSDVYGGRFDVPEERLSCRSCETTFRGPREVFSGKPCPQCGAVFG